MISRRNYSKVSILLGAVGVLFFVAGCSEEYSVEKKKDSPDGKYTAIAAWHYGGGAAGWADYRVTLLKKGEELSRNIRTSHEQAVFIAEDNMPDIEWKGPKTLLITYYKDDNYVYRDILKREFRKGDVNITYLTRRIGAEKDKFSDLEYSIKSDKLRYSSKDAINIKIYIRNASSKTIHFEHFPYADYPPFLCITYNNKYISSNMKVMEEIILNAGKWIKFYRNKDYWNTFSPKEKALYLDGNINVGKYFKKRGDYEISLCDPSKKDPTKFSVQ